MMFPKIGVLHGTPTPSISSKIFHMHFVGFTFLGKPPYRILLDIRWTLLDLLTNWALFGPTWLWTLFEFRQG